MKNKDLIYELDKNGVPMELQERVSNYLERNPDYVKARLKEHDKRIKMMKIMINFVCVIIGANLFIIFSHLL